MDGLLQPAPRIPGQLDQGLGELKGEVAEGAMGALLPSEVSLASALWPGANA